MVWKKPFFKDRKRCAPKSVIIIIVVDLGEAWMTLILTKSLITDPSSSKVGVVL